MAVGSRHRRTGWRLVRQRFCAKLAGMDELAQLEAIGLVHHRAGRLAQAEACYRKILAANPANPTALHLLGLIAQQMGEPQAAVELLARAIAVDDRVPELHGDLGHALYGLGRLPEAASSFRRAIALKEDDVAAHNNLGVVLMEQGLPRDAETCWRTATALAPDHPDAHSNLASALCAQGRADEAEASCRRAIALHADHAGAHNNLGNALKDQGRHEEARACYRRAITLDPNFADPHNNLGLTLEESGRPAEAEACYRDALDRNPHHADAWVNLGGVLIDRGELAQALQVTQQGLLRRESIELKRLFVRCLQSAGTHAVADTDAALRRNLLRALSEPWGRPAEVAAYAAAVLKQDAVLGPAIRRAAAMWPKPLSAAELSGAADLSALADDLLICLLESTPVCDLALEHFLTALRRLLLAHAGGGAGPDDPGALRLACALARGCFINEYVFAVDDREADEVAQLREAVEARLSSGAPMPAFWPAALATYVPLGSLANAALLLDRTWPEPLAGVLTQQILEPREELADRPSIPRLTPILDAVSLLVQQQYEESPYPRWVRTAAMSRPSTIDARLRRQLPGVALGTLRPRQGGEILIAGCGTGQHAIETAQRFPQASILAIDLSLASLAYARMRSRPLALHHIAYAQSDILQLGTLGRSFDLIEAVGVLHHLADPLAAWRILIALLRPGGVMRIGLYSALARSEIVAAQRFIAERGYGWAAEDVRAFRQDLLRGAPELAARLAAQCRDFFSTSECRDLLFHRQEHRFTLPQIKSFLAAERLTFLGFEIEGAALQLFRQQFPDRKAVTDLACWHDFETAHPQTFTGMYQFYVQNPQADGSD